MAKMHAVQGPKHTRGEKIGQIIIRIFLALLVFIMVYPLWYVVMYSISDPRLAMRGGAFLWPKGFDTYNYQMILKTSQIWVSLRNSVMKTIVGTTISVVLSLMTAYPLSLQRFKGRRFFQGMFFFTMLFNGGIIPTYLVVKNLGLLDSFLALVIPAAMSAYNMFILRNALAAVPASLEESARMDGAGPFRILMQIIAPIVVPSIAAVALFYGLGNWNSYLDGLIYTSSLKLQLMQIYLRNVLAATSSVNAIMSSVGEQSAGYLSQSSTEMAIVVLTVLPIMIVYPWLSRFYVSGLSVGAVKG